LSIGGKTNFGKTLRLKVFPKFVLPPTENPNFCFRNGFRAGFHAGFRNQFLNQFGAQFRARFRKKSKTMNFLQK
jgi:hypothetical protein